MKLPGLALLLLSLLGASPARAELPLCAPSSNPLIELVTDLDSENLVLAAALDSHLAAALAARGFSLCRGGVAPSVRVASLSIRISPADSGQIAAEIALMDAVTQKRVARRLELSAIPADSRALAVASSADELLRASWAELTLVDAPPPAIVPPPAITHALESSVLLAKPPPRAELDLEGSLDVRRYLSAFGAGVRLGYWVTPRWGLYVATGMASGLRRSAPHGAVKLSEIGVETGVDYAWVPISDSLGVAVEGGLSLQGLSFSAAPDANAEGHSFADWSLMTSARLRAWYGSRRLRATWSVGAKYGLRAARAYDESRIVSSNEGAGLESLIGVGLLF